MVTCSDEPIFGVIGYCLVVINFVRVVEDQEALGVVLDRSLSISV